MLDVTFVPLAACQPAEYTWPHAARVWKGGGERLRVAENWPPPAAWFGRRFGDRRLYVCSCSLRLLRESEVKTTAAPDRNQGGGDMESCARRWHARPFFWGGGMRPGARRLC